MEENGTFLITHADIHGKRRLTYAWYEGNRAAELACPPEGEASLLGNIYVGKVKNILTNINAAFIEIADGILCYYPLSEQETPLYTSVKKSTKLVAGDELLVQVSKEAVKSKAPTVTCNLNFAGRYLVLTTGKRRLGLSSKLNHEDRERLRSLIEPFLTPDFGIIVRTNAASATTKELETELLQLKAACQKTLTKGRSQTCFSLVYREPSPYTVRLRGLPREQLSRIVTDEKTVFEELEAYLAEHQPEDLEKLHFYDKEAPSLDSVYSLSREISGALSERVWLKSGGYLVIQPTEALTVIDVNTGKYTGKKNRDATFQKINLEAAKELARQLRLRNLSGIILVDFIDMDARESNACLMSELALELKKDPVRTTLVDMTPLGLVELTRKKVQKTLAEQISM